MGATHLAAHIACVADVRAWLEKADRLGYTDHDPVTVDGFRFTLSATADVDDNPRIEDPT